MNEHLTQTPQKIKKWIEGEKWSYKSVKDDDAIFNVVVYPNPSDSFNVIITNQDAQKVVLIARMLFREIDVKAYARLPEQTKRELLKSLETLLIQINVIYHIFPKPPDQLEGIELHPQIYFDGLTMDRFFDSVIALLRGLRIFRMNYHSLNVSKPSVMATE